MSTYVIGDIHGKYRAFSNLLDKISFNKEKDILWLTGDLIGRGEEPKEVLDLLISLSKNVICVLGNHDLYFLSVYFLRNSSKESDNFQSLLNAKNKLDYVDFLRNQKLVHYNKELKIVLVHAGIPPIWSVKKSLKKANELENVLKDDKKITKFLNNLYTTKPDAWHKSLKYNDKLIMIANYFTRMRFTTSNGRLEFQTKENINKNPEGFKPWFQIENPKLVGKKIFFGHWSALQGVTNVENIFALDTGCVWGGSLTAYKIESNQYFQSL